MRPHRILAMILLLVITCRAAAQDTPAVYYKFASAEGRSRFLKNVFTNNINRVLALPLTDSTEQDWQGSFWAMELLQHRTPAVKEKLAGAFTAIDSRSTGFQRALLELCYTNYPGQFVPQVTALKANTADPKIFAMCCEYLLSSGAKLTAAALSKEISIKFPGQQQHPILRMLVQGRQLGNYAPLKQLLPLLLGKNFMPGKTVVYSLQRKNRNYPGIVLVRNGDGTFVKNDSGKLFSVPQLARSITNLPGYLTNGNTPQGLFRMQGFAVSSGSFIGPTPNIQLVMPHESSIAQFTGDSTITDTAWAETLYRNLLPAACRSYAPLMESYYASQAGRNEIIAHGTTIDPGYYRGAPYWPHTPTLGCLCTKELWDAAGKRVVSNQQLLVDAVRRAGGAEGWLLVLELDDKKAPVQLKELAAYIR